MISQRVSQRVSQASSCPLSVCGLSLVLMMGLSALTLSCNPPAPRFIELSTPRGSIDSLGPYSFTARVIGSVDYVHVVWVRETPQDQLSGTAPSIDDADAQRVVVMRREGEVWVGELEGGSPIATYRYFLEAGGEGGDSREPLTGSDSFVVESLTGRCNVDSECLIGEVCHRVERYCFTPPERCDADFQCPRDQVCNLETRLCRFIDADPPEACDRDADCAPGERCERGLCRDDSTPIECDPRCADDERCVDGRCEPAMSDQECITDSMCPESSACDLLSRRCVVGERGHLCAPCGASSSEISDLCGVGFECVESSPGCRPTCGGPSGVGCHPDEECIDGVCIGLDLGACVYFECSSGSDCPSGACERGRCVDAPYCVADIDCEPSGVCNMGTGRCDLSGSCVEGSCPSGQLCLDGSCQAVPSGPSSCAPCLSDTQCGLLEHCAYDFNLGEPRCQKMCDQQSQCGGEQLCIFEGGLTAGGYCLDDAPIIGCAERESLECIPDLYEPNNTFERATLIPLLPSSEESIIGILCAYDDDYLKVEMGGDTDEDVTYQVNFQTLSPSFISLYDAELTFLDEVSNFFPIEGGVSFELGQARYLQVSGVDEVSDEYQLSFSPITVEPTACRGDFAESNNTRADAYPVGAGADLSLAICDDDEDWFRFRGNVGDVWSVELTKRTDAAGTIELSVASESSFEQGDASTWYISESSESVLHVMSSAESSYIQVRCIDCEGDISYGLTLSR